MPTKNFFNLAKNKQDAILNSAKTEFSNFAYEDVSVFQIAKNAGISRASFYCYFADKSDIYKYVLSQLLEEIKIKITSICSPPYFVFDAIGYIFEYLIEQKNTEKQALITKAFENFNPRIQEFFTDGLELGKDCTLVDFCDLNINKTQSRYFGFALISCLVFHTLEYYSTNISKQDIFQKFNSSLDILKFGVKRSKK